MAEVLTRDMEDEPSPKTDIMSYSCDPREHRFLKSLPTPDSHILKWKILMDLF